MRQKTWIKKSIRKNNIRLTRQREALIDYLINQETPRSAEEIFRNIKSTNISLTTVYRNLEMLKEIGIIEELTLQGGESKYIINYYSEHWHHAVCIECGYTKRLIDCPLNFEIIKKTLNHFMITGHRWEVYGVCFNCQQVKK